MKKFKQYNQIHNSKPVAQKFAPKVIKKTRLQKLWMPLLSTMHANKLSIAQNCDKYKQIHTSNIIQILGGCCLFQIKNIFLWSSKFCSWIRAEMKIYDRPSKKFVSLLFSSHSELYHKLLPHSAVVCGYIYIW